MSFIGFLLFIELLVDAVFLFSSDFKVSPKLLTKFSLPYILVMGNHVEIEEKLRPQDKVYLWFLTDQS